MPAYRAPPALALAINPRFSGTRSDMIPARAFMVNVSMELFPPLDPISLVPFVSVENMMRPVLDIDQNRQPKGD
ncbi:hypothetical protein [Aquamicrobium zhengzhouense]|uniref:hypothetical protein n=1 Tax=Aquamicrobium zhengzhouense TaxID=2781738 RepID=UPI0018E0DACE|nr:hypothetical protein [Aquamicrobium zhengzhouense]